MQKIDSYQSANVTWQIHKMKANLSKRSRTIELLREYNRQDGERLIKLTSYKNRDK